MNKHFNATHECSKHKLYSRWQGMMIRCYNPDNPKYPRYGGRGIKVCKRWHNPKNFITDMGNLPSKNYSLDRVNVHGDYEPSNCRWATQKTQQNNRENNRIVTAFGLTLSAVKWHERTGIPAKIILQRLDRNQWTPEMAVGITVDEANNLREFFGRKNPLAVTVIKT